MRDAETGEIAIVYQAIAVAKIPKIVEDKWPGISAKLASALATPAVTDEMVRAAINAHGSSAGATEWAWMQDALTAALRTEPRRAKGG